MDKIELSRLKQRYFGNVPLTSEELVAPTIDRARKLIEQRGWAQGALCTANGHCIVGAIIAVEENKEIQELAFDVIREECQCFIVSRWNDGGDRNKKEVLKTLSNAAARARNRLRGAPRMAGPERGSIFSFA